MKHGTLNLRQLDTFLAVARAGSFHAAARQLNSTQPAISTRIAQLEQTLGVRLFERTTRSCRLTPRGHSLVNHAIRVFAAASDLELGVGNHDIIAGVVRIGVVDTIAMTSLAEIVAQVQNRLPQVDLQIDVGLSVMLMQSLATDLLDLACLVAQTVPHDYVSERLADPEFRWYASPALSIPGGRLTADILAETPMLVHSGSQQASYLAPWLRRIAARPKRVQTCNSLATIIRLTEAGIGLSVLPVQAVADRIGRGLLVAVPSDLPTFDNPLVMVRHHASVDPAIAAVADIVRAVCGPTSAVVPETSGEEHETSPPVGERMPHRSPA